MNHRDRHNIELLAPAGSFESLKAAIVNGADAVYLGGGKFNARVNASNFSEDELRRALDYAHERDVRIYITLNTLLKNEEMEAALRFAAFAYREGADAFIIQDQGLLKVLREQLPELVIHASTQMTVTNSESVAALEKLGVKKFVLARELTLEEIRAMSGKSSVELEVFGHGALCICYSGQCLMSSFIGGRSGNRGSCAQPCRLPWSLSADGKSFGRESYLISPRDNMLIDFLPALKKAGVVSLKLEGRMKSPEYVAVVTSIYRKYLDLLDALGPEAYKVEDEDREKLMQAFNRGGFTNSYLKGDRNFKHLVYTAHPKNQGVLIGKTEASRPLYVKIKLDKPLHMGDGLEIMDEEHGTQSLIVTDIMENGAHTRYSGAGSAPWVGDIKSAAAKGSPVYRTLSKPLFEEAGKTYEKGETALVPVDMFFTLKTGHAAVLEVKDDSGSSIVSKTEAIAEKALRKPLSRERIKEQLQKTGDTPYYLRKLEIDTDEISTIPISALNALRREALEKLSESRIASYKRSLPEQFEKQFSKGQAEVHDSLPKPGKLALSAYFYKIPDTLINFDGLVQRVYLPVSAWQELEDLRKGFKGELFLWTPPVLKDGELHQIGEVLKESSGLWDGLAFGSPGALQYLKRIFPDKLFCADSAMNLFNDEAILLQKSLGVQTAVLSPELRLNEVQSFKTRALALEAAVYGRIPLMTMEYCPSSAEGVCTQRCASCGRREGFLKDRKGEVFPFVRDPVLLRTQIFNAMPVLMDDMEALGETGLSFLRLTFTNEDRGTCEKVTRYFYNQLKGIEDSPLKAFVQELKDRGYTKGHWFRGV
ncbi:MAG TPA: hypothetical protein DD738_07355 [Ruminiclostridium sp.]|nr:hypothetical protein [Ruminiclostridium sp.]